MDNTCRMWTVMLGRVVGVSLRKCCVLAAVKGVRVRQGGVLSLVVRRSLHLSTTWEAKNKGRDRKQKGGKNVSADIPDDIVNTESYISELTSEVEQLQLRFSKEISLRVDLRAYAQLRVDLGDGSDHFLEQLGRIRPKGASLVEISLTNPSHVKPVKLAIEKSGFGVSPTQEQLSIFVPIDRVTVERRTRLANSAASLEQQTKEKLKKIYQKYNKRLSDLITAGTYNKNELDSAGAFLKDRFQQKNNLVQDMRKRKQAELTEESI